jgi:hypothetical protein
MHACMGSKPLRSAAARVHKTGPCIVAHTLASFVPRTTSRQAGTSTACGHPLRAAWHHALADVQHPPVPADAARLIPARPSSCSQATPATAAISSPCSEPLRCSTSEPPLADVKLPAAPEAQPESPLVVPLLRRSGLRSSGRGWLLAGARGGSSAWWERAAGEGDVRAECRLLPGVRGTTSAAAGGELSPATCCSQPGRYSQAAGWVHCDAADSSTPA